MEANANGLPIPTLIDAENADMEDTFLDMLGKVKDGWENLLPMAINGRERYVWGYGNEVGFFDDGAFITIPLSQIIDRTAKVGDRIYSFQNLVDIVISRLKVENQI